jgi:two-component system, cell cycle response regulator DivK
MSEKVVLLVEDHDDSREIYGRILRHNGYQVLEATDGSMAVTVLMHVRPHLVLLDIALPRLDGWTVARWMKSGPDTARVPLVALTALEYSEHQAQVDEIGFDDYLMKPVDPVDLLKCVEQQAGPSLRDDLAVSFLGIEPPGLTASTPYLRDVRSKDAFDVILGSWQPASSLGERKLSA